MVFELFSTCGSVIEKNIDGFQNNNSGVNGNVNGNSSGNVNNVDVSGLVGSGLVGSGGIGSGVGMNCGEIILLILIIVVCTLPAVVIAVTCNPKNPVLMGIIAFFFDRIYLFQHVYRKYIIREKNYCKNISCRN